MKDKRIVVPFRTVAAPGESKRLSWYVKAEGTIEEVKIRFYPGPEGILHIQPFVIKRGGAPESLINYAADGENFVSGDDDYFEFPVTIGVEKDDQIIVDYKNGSTDFEYTVSCDFVIDYTAGKNTVR